MSKHADYAYWNELITRFNDIRSVTIVSKSVEENTAAFRRAARQFRNYVDIDLPSLSDRESLLEIGYGLGHYTHVSHEIGFQRLLGIDFVAPPGPDFGPEYRYHRLDVSDPFDFGRYDLVTAIDVIYNITDEERFERALDNIRKHARRFIYVTDRFENQRPCVGVVCRSLDRFERLGRLVRVEPWRDNAIACFEVDR